MSEREPPEVGQRIRTLRGRRGLSLRALARRSGLSVNAISRIERGEASPTVSSLHVLATALDVPITDLFAETDEHRTVFVQRDRRLRSRTGGLVMESLGSGLRRQQIEPFHVLLDGGTDATSGEVTHGGHEFVLCLSGSVEYTVDGRQYDLEEGDSLLFEAEQPHSFRNASDAPARLLLVFHGPGGGHLARQRHLAAVDEDLPRNGE